MKRFCLTVLPWTVLIDRKIACDASQPICKNCIRSNRSCKYHRLRLSWPKANDRRRALSVAHPNVSYKCKDWKFINTSFRDVNVHLRRINPSEFCAQSVGLTYRASGLILSRALSTDHFEIKGIIFHGHNIITPLASLLRVPSSKYMHVKSQLLEENINLVPYCKTSHD